MKPLAAKHCSVEVLSSIDDIDGSEWDEMADDVYMSYGWLRVIEESFLLPVDHCYFLVRANGTLMGGAVCHVHSPAGNSFTLDDSVFGRFKPLASRLGLSILPSLVCGPLRGYGQHFIYQPQLQAAGRSVVASALFDALEQWAALRRLSISFNNVMAGEKELIELLESRGFSRTVNFPLNYLEVRWQDPSGYRKLLARRKLVREINRNRREGVEITQLEDTEPHADRLHELLNDNYMKYNDTPLPVQKRFIGLCKKYLGSETTVYIARKKGEIIGTVILFHRNSVAYVTDVGIDHRASGNDFTYFNLTYYQPVFDAIEMKMKRIYYGTLMYSMKAHRGCTTTDIFLYHRPRNHLLRRIFVPLFAIHRVLKAWFIKRHYF